MNDYKIYFQIRADQYLKVWQRSTSVRKFFNLVTFCFYVSLKPFRFFMHSCICLAALYEYTKVLILHILQSYNEDGAYLGVTSQRFTTASVCSAKELQFYLMFCSKHPMILLTILFLVFEQRLKMNYQHVM